MTQDAPSAAPESAPSTPETTAATPDTAPPVLEPMRSLHTSTFPQILAHFGMSVLVTTYQAGRLVILRNDNGVLNTHFRLFQKPMGLALAPHRLALGCEMEIREFHSVPAVAPKLEPKGKHDVALLPRTAHATGDVQIHEMAWIDGEVWFVNTLFSCLCTRSAVYSFQPQWRPWFISQLAPQDRCHLNGLCVIDGKVRYVTALGETDEAAGWRKNKRDGGILIDVARQAIVARGLSMPHSPRWYRGKLWVLNSGTGGLGFVDPATGRYESVVELPGFTRGLSFAGPFAFVGLSQVRESAIFSGILIAERPQSERSCGVWVVNLDTKEIVAWVKFEDAVQEIFAVEVLPEAKFPDVVIDNREILAGSFILPDQALADVPKLG